MNPPIKWPGGKRWLAPTIASLYKGHEDRPLVEPFAGACAVSFHIEPEVALCNDYNPHVINFFWEVKQGLEINMPMENDRDMYYSYRGEFNQLVMSYDWLGDHAAELFYYLNKTGYNGLFRVNKKGRYNVPFGSYKTINYQRSFEEEERVIREWEFYYGDFEDTPIPPECFIYADPPYDDGFTAYTADGFSWGDQVRLCRWLAWYPGPVVASNKATPRIIDLYAQNGFKLRYISGPRSISSDGNRDQVLEILATKGV